MVPGIYCIVLLGIMAAAYVQKLGLDEDLEEDVQEEVDNAIRAWNKVVGGGGPVGDEAFFAALLGELGTAGDDAVSSELLALEKGSQTAFVEWYIKWLFHEEDVADDEDDETEQRAAAGEGGRVEANWSQVKWSVQPVAKPEEGVSWKCMTCKIINKWADSKCQGCDENAPHAAELPSASVSSAKPGFAFGGAAPASGTISSAGFTFTGAAPGAITSSGFTFAGTAAATPAAAPVSGGGFVFAPSASATISTSASVAAEASKETVFGNV